jgi:hypothetical protein
VSAVSERTVDTLDEKTLEQTHDDRYGGYVVRILKKDTGEAATVIMADQTKTELKPATFIIAVRTQKWSYEFAGAFTVNQLTDPVFALETRSTNGVEQQFLIEDEQARDTVKLGIGAFIHVFHDRLPWVAGTFGIGINSDSKATYYLGPTFRLSDAAGLTAGVVFGPIARLPAGTAVGQPAPDANVLNNLGTKIDKQFFVAVSYTFLGDRSEEQLSKPFAGGSTTQGQ